MNRTIAKVLTVILGVAVCICTQATCVGASSSGDNNPGIAPIQSHPFGESYGEWAATWWKWILEVPASTSPAFGTGNCEDGQSGKVWFLIGSFSGPDLVKRTCTIPAGTSLFFPLINDSYFAFQSDPPDQRTYEYVRSRSLCQGPPKTVVIDTKIDGVTVKNETRYYEQSPFFDVPLPVDNAFGLTGNDHDRLLSPSADSGYYLFLRPLEPGDHKIEWTAQWNCGSQNIHYDITVNHN